MLPVRMPEPISRALDRTPDRVSARARGSVLKKPGRKSPEQEAGPELRRQKSRHGMCSRLAIT
jgi:hypothetical protein